MTGRAKSPLEAAWPWIVRFLGVGIAIYETVIERIDRPSLLLLATVLIVGPEVVKVDRRRDGNGPKP